MTKGLKEVKTLKPLTVLCPPGSFGNTCGFFSYDDVHLSSGQAYTYIHGGLWFLIWLASYGMIDHVMHFLSLWVVVVVATGCCWD